MAEYIERTALRDALYDADAITMQGVKILNQFPTADVAPVAHGRLVETGMDEAWCSWGDCTVCGHSNIMWSHYCNYCGALMDGGADNA